MKTAPQQLVRVVVSKGGEVRCRTVREENAIHVVQVRCSATVEDHRNAVVTLDLEASVLSSCRYDDDVVVLVYREDFTPKVDYGLLLDFTKYTGLKLDMTLKEIQALDTPAAQGSARTASASAESFARVCGSLNRDAAIITPDKKPTDPKEACGIRKWRQFTAVPQTVIWELGVAMLEGARKYGRSNWRAEGVRASVYVDAALGHVTQWWEGEDDDPESGLSHLVKAIASLVVLRDSMIQGNFNDDRPPGVPIGPLREDLQAVVERLFEQHPVEVPAFTRKGGNDNGYTAQDNSGGLPGRLPDDGASVRAPVAVCYGAAAGL